MIDILVDYDNIDLKIRRYGAKYAIEKIIEIIQPVIIEMGVKHVSLRLYGGWYNQDSFSENAQKLSIEISREFPIYKKYEDSRIISIKSDLALSLKSNPTKNLFFTYREKSLARGIKCRNPSDIGCKNEDCPTQTVYNFFNNKIDTSECCGLRKDDLFYRAEQKLVDTMIASDAFYTTSIQRLPLIIVTSDDDLWPVIESIALQGSKVYHIHPNPMRTTKFEYTSNITTSNYFHFSLGD